MKQKIDQKICTKTVKNGSYFLNFRPNHLLVGQMDTADQARVINDGLWRPQTRL